MKTKRVQKKSKQSKPINQTKFLIVGFLTTYATFIMAELQNLPLVISVAMAVMIGSFAGHLSYKNSQN